MTIPEGMVIKLNNTIQGSPQASRNWQDKANDYLLNNLGFNQSQCNPTYYWKWDALDHFTQIIRLVDDFCISSDTAADAEEIFTALSTK